MQNEIKELISFAEDISTSMGRLHNFCLVGLTAVGSVPFLKHIEVPEFVLMVLFP